MNSDLQMYDEKSDERCVINSPTLFEELGQVTHSFSLKTDPGPPPLQLSTIGPNNPLILLAR